MNFNFDEEIPNGVSIDKNAKNGENIRASTSIANNTRTILKFRALVKNGGPMDYKTQGKEFENFGNYNYGVLGRSMGIDKNFLNAAAGALQAKNIMSAYLKNGKKWFDDNNFTDADKIKYMKYTEIADKINDKIGTEKTKDLDLFRYFLNESIKIGQKSGNYGYFDDPKDQKYINDGYEDAKNSGYGNDFKLITFDDFDIYNGFGSLFFL
ncbi:hypothetical protein F1B92_08485 [Campylobacter sp. FMV-PI01]|uniref:Uncharacterized protein n=1 Tax=Campylobacter portucalensis TaxID=2608384 RepID=A0A6L5WN39_9BACT|nr:polymorphic toxin type 44 domain-containing protein [Campylobacter portucalensis]MSN97193.1 hypothetical protein [Campylobacter portucalensis]